MFEISIKDYFSGAHNLRNYHGKCEHLHGHNWLVEVYIRGAQLDRAGMLVDFKILKQSLHAIFELLDHKYLNQTVFFKKNNPSAENIARFIYEELTKKLKRKAVKVSRVKVWESDNSCAIYYPD